MSSPEEIKHRIEETRSALSQDVNRLEEKVSPSKVVGRRVDSVKGSARSVKDRVMGTGSNVTSSAGGAMSNVQGSVSGAVSSAGDTLTAAPQQIKQQAQGNPLAAGLIAFGVGWLIASMAPATAKEEELARTAEGHAKELAGPAKEKAQEIASNLKEPVQQSVEQVKSVATDAATETVDHAKSAAQDVKEPLQQ